MAKTETLPKEKRINVDLGDLREPIKRKGLRLGLSLPAVVREACQFYLAKGRKR